MSEDGVPLPESDSPHTQLGTRKSKNGHYTQAKEWGIDEKTGKLTPIQTTDFSDHLRPQIHTVPHSHVSTPNKTGGTDSRPSGIPVSGWTYHRGEQ